MFCSKKMRSVFSSGTKHEEKEKEEEEIPQFRNCEWILELICLFFHFEEKGLFYFLTNVIIGKTSYCRSYIISS